MSIAKKLCLALAAGLIATTVAAEEPSPFLGNWSGVWPNGQHNEFNVVAVNAEGQITAVYCAERPNGFGFWFDIEPEGIQSSIKRRGTGPVLRPTRRQDALPIHPERRRHPHLPIHPQGQAQHASDGATRTLGLRRTDRAPSARVNPSGNLDPGRGDVRRARRHRDLRDSHRRARRLRTRGRRRLAQDGFDAPYLVGVAAPRPARGSDRVAGLAGGPKSVIDLVFALLGRATLAAGDVNGTRSGGGANSLEMVLTVNDGDLRPADWARCRTAPGASRHINVRSSSSTTNRSRSHACGDSPTRSSPKSRRQEPRPSIGSEPLRRQDLHRSGRYRIYIRSHQRSAVLPTQYERVTWVPCGERGPSPWRNVTG